ncbi:oligopeptide/dipeptide ABC transporter ATP-binding protein [Streptomyces sp. NPDC050528]|uniref:oligopeptide/dipeptide ABC transporter ATP-binding protein n=1 Tax=Streptomyces sp. NPDC050528 TaxID=3365623 RepID=UPI00379440B9
MRIGGHGSEGRRRQPAGTVGCRCHGSKFPVTSGETFDVSTRARGSLVGDQARHPVPDRRQLPLHQPDRTCVCRRDGQIDEVFERPRHPYTQALLSAVPLPNPVRERERQRSRILLAGNPPSPTRRYDGCRFRARCPLHPQLGEGERKRCDQEVPVLDGDGAACHFPRVREVVLPSWGGSETVVVARTREFPREGVSAPRLRGQTAVDRVRTAPGRGPPRGADPWEPRCRPPCRVEQQEPGGMGMRPCGRADRRFCPVVPAVPLRASAY